MRSVLNGFKDFISRGSAVDLAVGFILGVSFTAIVTALVDGIISPLVGIIFGQPSLTDFWRISIGNGQLDIGLVLDAVLQFLLVAAAVYFVIVLPLNTLAARRRRNDVAEPAALAEDVLLLQEIRDLLAAQAASTAAPARSSALPTDGGPRPL